MIERLSITFTLLGFRVFVPVEVVKNKKVELIAYGGDQVSHVQDDSLFEKYPFCQKPYAVTVCRIEPENNLSSCMTQPIIF